MKNNNALHRISVIHSEIPIAEITSSQVAPNLSNNSYHGFNITPVRNIRCNTHNTGHPRYYYHTE